MMMPKKIRPKTTGPHLYLYELACHTCTDIAPPAVNANFITHRLAGSTPLVSAKMEAAVDFYILLHLLVAHKYRKQNQDTLVEHPDNVDAQLWIPTTTAFLLWYHPLPPLRCQCSWNPPTPMNEVFGPPRLWAQDMCVLVHERDGRAPINFPMHYQLVGRGNPPPLGLMLHLQFSPQNQKHIKGYTFHPR